MILSITASGFYLRSKNFNWMKSFIKKSTYVSIGLGDQNISCRTKTGDKLNRYTTAVNNNVVISRYSTRYKALLSLQMINDGA